MAQGSESEAARIKSSEDIREDLECPVCFKIPRTTPIYQCEQGHIHCKTCHPRLRDCPVCRGSIGNTRNLVVEKIICKLPVQCTNFESGCQEPQALLDKITEHEKYCEFRMVNCFYEGCKDSVAFNNLVEHLKNPKHHRMRVKIGSKMTWNISANKHYEFLLEFEDRQFGVSIVIGDQTGCQVMRVFFLGSPKVAKTFRSIINFKSTEEDNDFEITFKRSISAYRDTLSDIGACLSIHQKMLEEIVNQENRYRMAICIISKSEDEPKSKRKRLEQESTHTPSTSSVPSAESQSSVAEKYPIEDNELILIDSDDE